jgi:uncharacterized oligopeptide transporter (OPT) family protein
LDDRLGPTARWLVAGLLVLAVAILAIVSITDGDTNGRQLFGIGVGVLVFGALALTATVALGDLVRMLWLRFARTGYSDPERRRQAQHLALHSVVLCGVCVVLIVGGPLRVLAAFGTQPTIGMAPPPATPTQFVRPQQLG